MERRQRPLRDVRTKPSIHRATCDGRGRQDTRRLLPSTAVCSKPRPTSSQSKFQSSRKPDLQPLRAQSSLGFSWHQEKRATLARARPRPLGFDIARHMRRHGSETEIRIGQNGEPSTDRFLQSYLKSCRLKQLQEEEGEEKKEEEDKEEGEGEKEEEGKEEWEGEGEDEVVVMREGRFGLSDREVRKEESGIGEYTAGVSKSTSRVVPNLCWEDLLTKSEVLIHASINALVQVAM